MSDVARQMRVHMEPGVGCIHQSQFGQGATMAEGGYRHDDVTHGLSVMIIIYLWTSCIPLSPVR